MAPSCNYCGRILVTDEQVRFGYCGPKCKDSKRGSVQTPRKIEEEARRLMQQYERGGWKP